MPFTLPGIGMSGALDTPPFLEILIIYDDVWSGSHAVHVVSTLNERLGSHVSLAPHLWPASCLDDEDSFDLAMEEGIKAEMVLIAAGETFEPGDSFRNWLKMCVDRKRGTESVIVLMQDGAPADSMELAGAQFVRRTARDAGLDF